MNILPVSFFTPYQSRILLFLKDLVEMESPSTHKPALDILSRWLAQQLSALHAEVKILPQASAGSHVLCRWGEGEGTILLLSHFDTVFDLGTLDSHPFREADGMLLGPGVLDMKASIAMLLGAFKALAAQGAWPHRPITALFTSDEEIGSASSRAIIEEEARKAAAVFCLEPALTNGGLKTARKGTGDIEITVKGVAAHAGVNHESGRNAIQELAYHILSAQQLTDYARETTVNVGVVRGGTRANVVPENAHALVDFRIVQAEEYTRLEAWVKSLQPVIQGTRLTASITLNRPPMPRDDTMIRAFARAQAIGRQMGLELTEGSTGGGSDANFVAPLGIPVLDGLGAVGDGAHSEKEFVWLNSLPERAALLSNLLLNW